MKKYLSLFLVTIFILSLTACKKNGNNVSVYDNTTSGFIDLDIAPENQDENQNNESNNTDSSNEEDEKGSKDDKDKDSDSKKEDKENHSDSQNNLSNNQNGNNQNGSSNKNPSNINQNDNNNQNGNSNDSNTNNPSNENDKNYKEIKCRVVDEWKSVELVSNNNVLYLKVNIPSDWNVTENGIIKIKNTQIGQITTKLTENFTNIYEEIKSENTLLSDFTASSSVREYTANKETKYKRIIKISKLVSSGSLLNLFISTDYSQLDDDATEKILNSILNNGEYKPNPLLDKNTSKNILMLGNNNIENSKIDEYLSSLLNSGNKAAKVVSNQPVGGGEVNNFASNSAIMDKISSGEYSAVILNGFYSVENTIEPIKMIINACKKSNTLLILLPAFDDDIEIVNDILSNHQSVYSINWKSEIEKLIKTGKNGITSLVSTDFHSNSNESSTELSGYVGASLIYRTLFNENAPAISSNLPDGYEKIKDYFTTGIIPGETKNEIYFIQ